MITWLENRDNMKIITGSGNGGPVISGLKVKKVDGFKLIAEYIKKLDGANWSVDSTKKRYEAMLKRFNKTKSLYEDNSGTKFCLSEREIANGLTINGKLDNVCPGYFRLDALFGSRQNITPSSVFETSQDENIPGRHYQAFH